MGFGGMGFGRTAAKAIYGGVALLIVSGFLRAVDDDMWLWTAALGGLWLQAGIIGHVIKGVLREVHEESDGDRERAGSTADG